MARGNGCTISFAVAMRPDQLAGAAVQRDDRTPCTRGGIEHAFDGERCSLELVLGARAEVVGLEAPRDFELAEVARVDLIERRESRATHVGREVGPVAVLRAPP